MEDWVWERIFDAIMYLQGRGMSAESVFNMRPTTFKEVYRSSKRLEVDRLTIDLYAMNQAMNGTEDSITKFITSLDVWGTKQVESRTRIQGYQASLKGKGKRR